MKRKKWFGRPCSACKLDDTRIHQMASHQCLFAQNYVIIWTSSSKRHDSKKNKNFSSSYIEQGGQKISLDSPSKNQTIKMDKETYKASSDKFFGEKKWNLFFSGWVYLLLAWFVKTAKNISQQTARWKICDVRGAFWFNSQTLLAILRRKKNI